MFLIVDISAVRRLYACREDVANTLFLSKSMHAKLWSMITIYANKKIAAPTCQRVFWIVLQAY